MDNRSEIREFLISRRAKVSPERAGLPVSGANRRVAGLRRAEVAMLADVSVEYYSKLERGNIAGASDSVLHSIATALHLDDAERAHLFDLARAANAPAAKPRRRTAKSAPIRPGLQRALDAITAGPAFVRNGRMDILAVNPLGKAFYADVLAAPGLGNLARFCFLDQQRSRIFYPDWEAAADVTVAILRTEAGRDPHNKDLQDLIGELSSEATSSAPAGGRTTCADTGQARKPFATPSSGTSP